MTEAIDLVPQQVFPPGTDRLACGTPTGITRQQRETGIVHLIQMKDALDIYHEHQQAGQKPTLQGAVLIGETLLGDIPPVENLGQQQEGTRVLRVAKKNPRALAVRAGQQWVIP